MCIACEMNFWAMIDALPEADRERILRQQAERFACEAPESAPQPAPQPVANERQS